METIKSPQQLFESQQLVAFSDCEDMRGVRFVKTKYVQITRVACVDMFGCVLCTRKRHRQTRTDEIKSPKKNSIPE